MTTKPDFKDLCRRLADELELTLEHRLLYNAEESDFYLVKEARAALDADSADERQGTELTPTVEPEANRLRLGDIWEFEMDVVLKGKKRRQPLTLQWEVTAWFDGDRTYQLKCLDARVTEILYLNTFDPGLYPDMNRIKWGGGYD